MAKYQITIEFITRLSREVEANSTEEAEQFIEHMYQEYKKRNNTDIISTEQHRKVELLSDG
jgi:hypothetical protein